MRVKVIGHGTTYSALGLLSVALYKRFGNDCHFIFHDRDDPENVDRIYIGEADHDLQVHLGSDWSLTDTSFRREKSSEMWAIERACDLGIPVIGICYGAQLISKTFGGDVVRCQTPELGWCEVHALNSAPFVGGKWMQWHYDSFSAPPDFDVLAANESGIQVIHKKNTLGVQFHPEVTEAIILSWISEGGGLELVAQGKSSDLILAETRQEVLRTAVDLDLLLQWFLDSCQ